LCFLSWIILSSFEIFALSHLYIRRLQIARSTWSNWHFSMHYSYFYRIFLFVSVRCRCHESLKILSSFELNFLLLSLFCLCMSLSFSPSCVNFTNILRAPFGLIILCQKLQSQNVTREKLVEALLYKYFCEECWWNWALVSISSTFYEQL